MGTNIRTGISRRSKHWIPKERRLELIHFCLQMPSWVAEVGDCNAYLKNSEHKVENSNSIGRHTEEVALRMAQLNTKIDMIRNCAKEADPVLAKYIVTAVANGKSYSNLRAMYDIPCGKDMFYSAYRKFFYLLDKERG